jgi:hypothetical protein
VLQDQRQPGVIQEFVFQRISVAFQGISFFPWTAVATDYFGLNRKLACWAASGGTGWQRMIFNTWAVDLKVKRMISRGRSKEWVTDRNGLITTMLMVKSD